VALLRKMTCDLRHPMSLRHSDSLLTCTSKKESYVSAKEIYLGDDYQNAHIYFHKRIVYLRKKRQTYVTTLLYWYARVVDGVLE